MNLKTYLLKSVDVIKLNVAQCSKEKELLIAAIIVCWLCILIYIPALHYALYVIVGILIFYFLILHDGLYEEEDKKETPKPSMGYMKKKIKKKHQNHP